MADYIDRDTVLDKLHEIGGCDAPPDTWADGFDKAIDEAYRAVQGLTTADVAPVVHGQWEFLGPNRLVRECMCGTCSVCKVRSKYIVNVELCPNCGARMGGGD